MATNETNPPALTRRWSCALLVLLATLTSLATRAQAVAPEHGGDSGWAVTAYHGWYTDGATLGETLRFQTGLDSSFQFLGVAVSKRLTTVWSGLDIEGEGQLLKHYGDQRHEELAALLVARWRRFPWDRWLQTGLAAGLGLSAARDEPRFELKYDGRTTNVLAAIMVEVEVGLRRFPNWTLVGRIHHRSSAFNLLFDGNVGSNAYALGLKYRFR